MLIFLMVSISWLLLDAPLPGRDFLRDSQLRTGSFKQGSSQDKSALTVHLDRNVLYISPGEVAMVKFDLIYDGTEQVKVSHVQQLSGLNIALNPKHHLFEFSAAANLNFSKLTYNLTFSVGEVKQTKQLTIINRVKPQQQDDGIANKTSNVRNIQYAEISSQGSGWLQGKLTYQRLNFVEAQGNQSRGFRLDPDHPQVRPSRFIELQLLDHSETVIGSTLTNNAGEFEFYVPDLSESYFKIKVIARLVPEGVNGFNISVRDQATHHQISEQQIYSYLTDSFRIFEGENIHDISLNTGWHESLRQFMPEQSVAQPFAILDTLYKGVEFITNAKIEFAPSLQPLVVNWSQNPNAVTDYKHTAYYSNNRIYLSGITERDPLSNNAITINEWNEHTILHEFGHFYQSKFIGRNDSQNGRHYHFEFATPTLALSEGLATAIAKATLQDWRYKRVADDIDKIVYQADPQALIDGELDEQQSYRKANDGTYYQKPSYEFSPYEEETTSYFLLSLIDPQAQYTKRTAQLADLIGMNGLHQALVSMAKKTCTNNNI